MSIGNDPTVASTEAVATNLPIATVAGVPGLMAQAAIEAKAAVDESSLSPITPNQEDEREYDEQLKRAEDALNIYNSSPWILGDAILRLKQLHKRIWNKELTNVAVGDILWACLGQ